MLRPGSKLPECSEELREIISKADYASCNFEGAVRAMGKPGLKAGPHIEMSEQAAEWLSKLGFSIFNLANNHIYDFGKEGLKATLLSLKDKTTIGAGLDFSEAYSMKVVYAGDTSIGCIALGEAEFGALTEISRSESGFAWVNHPYTDKFITESRKSVDVLLVQVHAGVEKTDIPLSEWRARYKQLTELGADAVIASHPHVPQGWEYYNGKPVFYSLGNFYFDSSSASDGMGVTLLFDGKTLKGVETTGIENSKGKITLQNTDTWKNTEDKLCGLLKEPEYSTALDDMVIQLWKERYRHHYERASNGITRYSIVEILKHIKNMFILKKPNFPLLQHNIRIESHFWAVRRAVERIMEKL